MRDQNKRRNLADHQQRGASGAQWAQRATALLWTLRPRWSKGRNDHLFVLSEHSPCTAAPLRCKYVPGEARLLDDRSSFPKGKYSPSESESVNNICNTSSRYNFLLAIWRFSLTNLTITRTLWTELLLRINDTIAHLPLLFARKLWIGTWHNFGLESKYYMSAI